MNSLILAFLNCLAACITMSFAVPFSAGRTRIHYFLQFRFFFIRNRVFASKFALVFVFTASLTFLFLVECVENLTLVEK